MRIALAPAPFRLIVAPAPALAEQLAERVLQQRLSNPQRPLGLATGRTMEPLYRALAAAVTQLPSPQLQRLRQQWCSFNLDEYVGLGRGDAASFAASMARALVEPLGLDPARVQLPDGVAADPGAEACRYGAALVAAGGIGLQLLGIGLSGHVGFNEPPCGPASRCRVVELDPLTRQQNAAAFGGDPERVPQRAITLGLAEILAADAVVLLATGAAKAAVLHRALVEPPSPELPASWLQGHDDLTVMADPEAAALL